MSSNSAPAKNLDALPGVALISGAGSGIGRGVAISFAEAGCTKICIGDINASGLAETEALITTIGSDIECLTFQVDICNEKSVNSWVESCVSRFGRIDYANNVAGVVPQRIPISDNDVATLDKVIDVNLCGTWLCHKAQIKQMMTQQPLLDHNVTGSIISVASLSGINASPGMSTYCASKHGIVGICKTDALDYGQFGIRVNVVCPGMIDTALFRKTSPPGMAKKMEAMTPMRRLGQPGDIGDVMVWLSGPTASFVTGAVIPVDGGLCLYRP